VEYFTGSLAPGQTQSLWRKYLQFSNDRAFKLVRMHIECVSTKPALVQLRGYGPLSNTSAIKQSDPFCVGVTPRRHTLAVNSPWFQQDTDPEKVLGAFDVLCPSKKDAAGTLVTHTITAEFLLSPEMIPEACLGKTLLTQATEDFDEAQREKDRRLATR